MIMGWLCAGRMDTYIPSYLKSEQQQQDGDAVHVRARCLVSLKKGCVYEGCRRCSKQAKTTRREPDPYQDPD